MVQKIRKYLLLFVLLNLSWFSYCQVDTNKINHYNVPLFLVNGKEVAPKYLYIYSVERSSHFIPAEKAIKEFGEKAKYGAFLIFLNKDINYWNIDSIYTAFGIPLVYQKLPVFIDATFLIEPRKLIAEKGHIAEVSIVFKNEKKGLGNYILITTTGRVAKLTRYDKMDSELKRLQ